MPPTARVLAFLLDSPPEERRPPPILPLGSCGAEEGLSSAYVDLFFWKILVSEMKEARQKCGCLGDKSLEILLWKRITE